ncbi:VOC family protein [Georgenia yuyongxinii]|uniref:VOC family protein n=1 Tax=Georgenia yuyongxinii TaxID=2589797 RepID=A0A5B8C2T6_9MICO|nr:VOC family protein [Georgenia yuyongxinii]QDC23545.1 VOC family protein [Georgenia yuyongxinii]
MTESTSPSANTVTWWELPVTEVARAKVFYSTVFGWTFSSFGQDEDYAGVEAGGALVGGLYKAPPDSPTAPGVRVYVLVTDLEATLAAVEAAGGSVTKPRTFIADGMGWWAEIADPDGWWLGLTTDNAARD